VTAVGEGRKIYENIRKAIQYLLSSNLAEVIAVFIATMCGYTLLRPIHLLWINLISDSFPAIALGMEEGESDLMKRKPRNNHESIFSHGLGVNVVLQGAYIGILTLVGFFIGKAFGGAEHGVTMAFLVLALTESFHSFDVRSLHHSVFSMKKQNKILWWAAAFSLVMTIVVVFVPPIAEIFKFTPVGAAEFAIALALSLSIVLFTEICKLIQRKRNK